MPFSRSQQPGVFGGPECPYRGRPFAEQNKDVGPDHLYDWPPALPESDAFVREQVRHHFHDGPLVPGTVLTDVPAATDDHFVTLDTEDLRELMVPTAQLLHQTGSHNSPAPAVGGPAVDLELDAQQNHPDSLPLTTSSAIPFDRAPASEIPRLQAAVHQRHPAWFSELKDEDICVEHITGDEVDEARRLHQEWFPLKYDEAFYAVRRTGRSSRRLRAPNNISKRRGAHHQHPSQALVMVHFTTTMVEDEGTTPLRIVSCRPRSRPEPSLTF